METQGTMPTALNQPIIRYGDWAKTTGRRKLFSRREHASTLLQLIQFSVLFSLTLASVPRKCLKGNLRTQQHFECRPSKTAGQLIKYDFILMTCETTEDSAGTTKNITLNALSENPLSNNTPPPMSTESNLALSGLSCKLVVYYVTDRDLCEWRCVGVRDQHRDLLCVVDTRQECVATTSLASATSTAQEMVSSPPVIATTDKRNHRSTTAMPFQDTNANKIPTTNPHSVIGPAKDVTSYSTSTSRNGSSGAGRDKIKSAKETSRTLDTWIVALLVVITLLLITMATGFLAVNLRRRHSRQESQTLSMLEKQPQLPPPKQQQIAEVNVFDQPKKALSHDACPTQTSSSPKWHPGEKVVLPEFVKDSWTSSEHSTPLSCSCTMVTSPVAVSEDSNGNTACDGFVDQQGQPQEGPGTIIFKEDQSEADARARSEERLQDNVNSLSVLMTKYTDSRKEAAKVDFAMLKGQLPDERKRKESEENCSFQQ